MKTHKKYKILSKEECARNRRIKNRQKLAKGVVFKEKPADKTVFDENIRKFVRLHYHTDGIHKGNIIVKTRGVRHLEDGITPVPDGGMKLLGFWKPEDLGTGITGKRQMPYNSYYITANSFVRYLSRKNQLFTFHNIVADIDCHNWRRGKDGQWMTTDELNHIMRSFVFRFLNDFAHEYGIPAPNTIVYTGRGIQMWWALEPISAKCEKMYKRAVKYIMDRIDKILVDHCRDFAILSLDHKASENPAGLFRLPMTLNQKTGTCGKIEFCHDKRMDLAAFWEEVHEDAKEDRPEQNFFRKKGNPGDPKALADFRRSVLIEFVSMRIEDGCTMEGIRDLILFDLYNSMVQAYPDETAFEQALIMNRMLPKPLPEHEVETYLSTSRRKAGQGQPYRLTNATIIENLGILPEEQQQLKFFAAGTGQSQQKKREEARQKKAERDQKITELAKAGKNKKEIAAETGCSASTVASVLKKNGCKTAAEKTRRSICLAIKKGQPLKKIAERTGRTLKCIRELKRRIQEFGYDAVIGKKRKKTKKENAENREAVQAETTQEQKEAAKETDRPEPETSGAAAAVPENNRDGSTEPEKKEEKKEGDKKTAEPEYDEESWQYLLNQFNREALARGVKKMAYFWHRGPKKKKTGRAGKKKATRSSGQSTGQQDSSSPQSGGQSAAAPA